LQRDARGLKFGRKSGAVAEDNESLAASFGSIECIQKGEQYYYWIVQDILVISWITLKFLFLKSVSFISRECASDDNSFFRKSPFLDKIHNDNFKFFNMKVQTIIKILDSERSTTGHTRWILILILMIHTLIFYYNILLQS